MNAEEIIEKLASLADAGNVAGMRRFGITAEKAFGVAMPALKEIAKEAKRRAADRHGLALALWATGFHEARVVAYLTDDPAQVNGAQMDAWAADFDSWAICDGACGHLFRRTALAYEKAFEWSARDEEFIKRAGIVLMAWLAVHDKKASDERFAAFLPVLETAASDERNFVKKAVNWSLRQIGKRSLALNRLAVAAAARIKAQNTRAARWIAADALRELTSAEVRERLRRKK